MKEVDVARPVVQAHIEWGWDVYQEVKLGERVMDIVALQGPLVRVVEVKTSLSWTLLDQAWFWRGFAHQVSVAVPRRYRAPGIKVYVLRQLGLGLLEVTAQEPLPAARPELVAYRNWVDEIVSPELNRRPIEGGKRLRNLLEPEHKTFAEAGAPDGSVWSPWKRTCRAVAALVAEKPGLTMAELVEECDHHYSSASGARSSLATWIQAGKIPGVELRREGRRLRIYPVSKAELETCEGRAR